MTGFNSFDQVYPDNKAPVEIGSWADLSKRSWQSERVLDFVRGPVQGDLLYQVPASWFLEIFDNGREKGYTIKIHWNRNADEKRRGMYEAVSWAEHRNSDNIILYPGGFEAYERKGGLVYPDDCVFVKYRRFEEAARKILRMLIGNRYKLNVYPNEE